MIQAVLFDYYGVLTQPEIPALKTLAQRYGLDGEKKTALGATLAKHAAGLLVGDAFFESLQSLLDDNAAAIQTIWKNLEPTDALAPDRTMLAFVRSLKGRGLTTAVISNVFPQSAQTIRRLGGYNPFDKVFLSPETHLLKPDVQAYLHASEALRLPPSQLVLIDDKASNLEPAKQLGMQTIQFVGPVALQRGLEEVLTS